MKFLNLQQKLADRSQAGLLRQRRTIQNAQQSECVSDNVPFINFSSNDYLGLANSDAAKEALAQSAKEFGFGSGASHLICGHQTPHDELEVALAEFVERDAAVTFSTGYMANLAILQSLTVKGDLIVADKLNHASLIDGVRLSEADGVRYPHCNLTALEKRLKKSSQNTFVVTDSVFSMDGDIAPLDVIAELCNRYKAILIVDDAHGFGVLGENGRGAAEHFSLTQKQLPVLMSTLGKAIGGFGAFVSGEQELVDYLIQFARSYIYTTAMPAANAAANLANLEQLKQSPNLLQKLHQNIEYFRGECSKQDIELLASNTPIQPICIGDNQKLLQVNRELINQGILVGAIRPPTVPQNSARLRITITAAHLQKDIDRLVRSLRQAISG